MLKKFCRPASVLVTATLVIGATSVACKSDAPPKPASDDKKAATDTYTNTWVNTHTDTGTGTWPGAGTNPLDDGRCQIGAQPTFTSTGGAGTSLQIYPGSSVNWTFRASDATAACVYEIYHIDAMNLPMSLTVTNNDSAQVSIIGVPNTGSNGVGSSMTNGTITVKARNITTCARTSSDAECRNYYGGGSSGSSFDVSGSFQWTLGGGAGMNGTIGGNTSNANDMMILSIGMSLISSLLGGGGGGNPLAGLGGLSGGGLPQQGGSQPFFPGSSQGLGGQGLGGQGLGGQQGLGSGSCSSLSQYQCQQSTSCQWNGSSCATSNGQQGLGSGSCSSLSQYQCQQSTSCQWNGSYCTTSNGQQGQGTGSCVGLGQTQCQNNFNCTWDQYSNSCR